MVKKGVPLNLVSFDSKHGSHNYLFDRVLPSSEHLCPKLHKQSGEIKLKNILKQLMEKCFTFVRLETAIVTTIKMEIVCMNFSVQTSLYQK